MGDRRREDVHLYTPVVGTQQYHVYFVVRLNLVKLGPIEIERRIRVGPASGQTERSMERKQERTSGR